MLPAPTIVSLEETGSGFFGILSDGRAYLVSMPENIDEILKFPLAYLEIQSLSDRKVPDLSFDGSQLELANAQIQDSFDKYLTENL